MKKFSNDKEVKPIQTNREKVDEIYRAVMNANDIVGDQIYFEYLAPLNIICVYKKEPFVYLSCCLKDDKKGYEHSEILRTIQAWQSEKLEENINKIYKAEQKRNADTAISTLS